MRETILHHLQFERGEMLASQIVADFIVKDALGIGEAYTLMQVNEWLYQLQADGKVDSREYGDERLWRYVPEVRGERAKQTELFS